MLRHYYLARLGEVAFWKKVATGNVDFALSAAILRQNMRLAASERNSPLPQRVVDCLGRFKGQVMVVLSGEDLTAREFAHLMARHDLKARRVDIAHANHTFASQKLARPGRRGQRQLDHVLVAAPAIRSGCPGSSSSCTR